MTTNSNEDERDDDCPICAGTGQNPAGNGVDCDDDPCPNCGGTGKA